MLRPFETVTETNETQDQTPELWVHFLLTQKLELNLSSSLLSYNERGDI